MDDGRFRVPTRGRIVLPPSPPHLAAAPDGNPARALVGATLSCAVAVGEPQNVRRTEYPARGYHSENHDQR